MAGQKALKILSVAAAITALLVVGFVVMKINEKAPVASNRLPPETLISYHDLPEGSLIEATLSMSGKVTELENTGTGFVLSPQQKSSFSMPYSIKATLKSGDSYRDISWEIDSRGVAHNILIDGFTPRDKATLIMNDQPVYTVPFDWSGRLELGSMLIVATDSKPCFNVQDGNKSYGFCHFVRGKKAA